MSAWGLDADYIRGPLDLRGEFATATVDGVPDDNRFGYYGQIGYHVLLGSESRDFRHHLDDLIHHVIAAQISKPRHGFQAKEKRPTARAEEFRREAECCLTLEAHYLFFICG